MALPELRHLDTTPLIGSELASVLVAVQHLELRFQHSSRKDACRIDIEAGFILRRRGAEAVKCDNATLRAAAPALLELIGQSVKLSSSEPTGELTFVFEGATLTLLMSAQGFESYHLHTPNGSVTV